MATRLTDQSKHKTIGPADAHRTVPQPSNPSVTWNRQPNPSPPPKPPRK